MSDDPYKSKSQLKRELYEVHVERTMLAGIALGLLRRLGDPLASEEHEAARLRYDEMQVQREGEGFSFDTDDKTGEVVLSYHPGDSSAKTAPESPGTGAQGGTGVQGGEAAHSAAQGRE